MARTALTVHVFAACCVVVLQAGLSHPLAANLGVPAEQWRRHLARWQTAVVLPWCLVSAACVALAGLHFVVWTPLRWCCRACRRTPAATPNVSATPPSGGDAPPRVAAAKQRGGNHLVRRRYPSVPAI